MKSLLIALVTITAGAGIGRAELFSPSVLPGAVIGGVAGAVIGNNSGHHGADGAIIGAVAGGLIGAAIDQDHSSRGYYAEPPVRNSCETTVYVRPAPRVIYVPAPPPRVVYVQPRGEVIVRSYDRHDERGRYEQSHYRDDRRYHDYRR